MGLRAPRLSALQEKLWSSLRTEEYVCGDPVSRDVKKKNWKTLPHAQETQGTAIKCMRSLESW